MAEAKAKAKAKAGRQTVAIGLAIENMPGALVQDLRPGVPKDHNFRGLVLSATVASRTSTGRYLLSIEGTVPAPAGQAKASAAFEHRTDLKLTDKRGLTAALVKRLAGLTEDEACEWC